MDKHYADIPWLNCPGQVYSTAEASFEALLVIYLWHSDRLAQFIYKAGLNGSLY